MSGLASGSEAISPTAHYTGYVWVRNGLSHPALATTQGRVLFEALAPANRLSRLLGGPTLEAYLLARHRAIDALLTEAIEQARICQVLELACGLSPRGWRFAERFGTSLTYIEADLPGMAARKRRALSEIGTLGERHRVVELDALRERGPGSLAALAAELDPARGLAVITEGLLGYLPTSQVLGLWRRVAQALGPFDAGRYISDLHLAGEQSAAVRGFRLVLSGFVRGRVHLHYDSAGEAEAALRAAGFAGAALRPADAIIAGGPAAGPPRGDPGQSLAHILEART